MRKKITTVSYTHLEPLAAFASEAMQAGLWKNIAKTRYVNDKQITDHYAIIPTGQGLGALRSCLLYTYREVCETPGILL